jgi:glycosyltransferase involved in cell wall biosynthesis
MKVVFYHRKNGPSPSVENLFTIIRAHFSESVDAKIFFSKFPSQGIFKRIYNIVEAYFQQGDINHITGDVHFLTYFLKKNRTILTVLDCGSFMHSTGIKRSIIKLLWYTIPAKKVQYITVISENTKMELLKIIDFPEDRVFLVPACISEKFKFIEKPSFNNKKPRILQIGTMFNKNLIRVCQALKGFPCTLDIVGKLSNEQLTVLSINNIDYINSFELSEDEIMEKYYISDIFIFVSTYEGFGMPILESQATGTVLIASNTPPINKVAGIGACLVDEYSIIDIRKKVEEVVSNDSYRMELIEYGFKNIKKYHADNVSSMYENIYKKVLTKE